jgi:hypothetical protein
LFDSGSFVLLLLGSGRPLLAAAGGLGLGRSGLPLHSRTTEATRWEEGRGRGGGGRGHGRDTHRGREGKKEQERRRAEREWERGGRRSPKMNLKNPANGLISRRPTCTAERRGGRTSRSTASRASRAEAAGLEIDRGGGE